MRGSCRNNPLETGEAKGFGVAYDQKKLHTDDIDAFWSNAVAK